MSTKRVALTYERVSVDKRDQKRSVTEQYADNLEVINREVWTHAADFRDNDRSASKYATKPRPGYLQLRQAVKDGLGDAIVTWELSRLSRDLGTLIALRDLCRDQGVLWSIGGRTYDPADDRDTMGLIIQAVQAEGESAQTSKRVRRSTAASAVAGTPHGKNLYGYRRNYDPTSKALREVVVDEAQASVLREAAQRVLDGETLYTVVQDFNARGIRTARGKSWQPANLHRTLTNPSYAGRRTHHGADVGDAIWPALFDDVTWLRLQKTLARRSSRSVAAKGLRYLLSGTATCGVCGAPVEVSRKRNMSGKHTLFYRCRAGYHVVRQLRPIDFYVVEEALTRLVLRDDLYQLVAGQQSGERLARKAKAEADALRQRMQEASDAYSDEKISLATLTRIEANLAPKIADAQAKERQAALTPAKIDLGEVIDVHEAWDALTIKQQRRLLRALVTVKVLPVGNGNRSVPMSESVTVEPRPYDADEDDLSDVFEEFARHRFVFPSAQGPGTVPDDDATRYRPEAEDTGQRAD